MARLTPGPMTTVAQESISSRLLIDHGIVEPDFFPTVMSMYPELTPFTALLDAKGFKTKGLNMGSNYMIDGGNYRTVSSNHIQYRLENSDVRREHFTVNSTGLTFLDAASSTYPGQDKRGFYIYLDSNWIGSGDVALMADGTTQLYFSTDGEEVSGGAWEYKVKVDGKNTDEYADPELMMEGDEIMLATTKFTHDFSVGGNERHTFGGFGDAYLTLQRFKYSWSGTAKAMDSNKNVTGRFVQHGGNTKDKAFLPKADEEMMKFVSKANEFALFEGKGTIHDTTKKVTLTDAKNAEIVSGDGVLYAGDGPIEFPLNDGWTKQSIEAFLTDADSYIRPDEQGNTELALFRHPVSYNSFQGAMRDMGVTIDSNIVGVGNDKLINNTYKGYSLGGLTILAHKWRGLEGRPGKVLADGTKTNEWDAVGIPLGLTAGGARGIQLVQLRGMIEGTVQGIDAGGNIATEIDGSSKHVLLQNGVISQIQAFKIGRPWKGNII